MNQFIKVTIILKITSSRLILSVNKPLKITTNPDVSIPENNGNVEVTIQHK